MENIIRKSGTREFFEGTVELPTDPKNENPFLKNEKEGSAMSVDVQKLNSLSDGGKEELALALYLWKEFKRQDKMDSGIYKKVFEFADILDIRKQYEELEKKILVPIDIKMEKL